jgi:MFS family permease
VSTLKCVVVTMFTRFRSQLSFQAGQVIAFVLLFNSLSWFFIGRMVVATVTGFFSETGIETLSLNVAYPISIIVSGIIGATSLTRVRRIRFFYLWLVSGIAAPLFLPFVSSSYAASLGGVALMGSSLGLGIPLCLAYFSESVPIEKRGKVGGLIFLLSSLSVPLIALTMRPAPMSMRDLVLSVVIFAAWRGWGFLALVAIPKNRCYSEPLERRDTSFASVLQDRTFLLYFVAWFVFSLVDSFESVVFELRLEELAFLMLLIEPAIAGLSALVAGVFSDWIGRKRVMIFGFVSLGVAYAILGIVSETLWLNYFIIIHFFVNGAAIGLLWLLFTIVLWGDMSRHTSEKYYAIGETPLFLTQIISPMLATHLEMIPVAGAFSLAAFFLFIAVIPLLYAPETLPEKKIQERQIQMYTEEALKMKQKTEEQST